MVGRAGIEPAANGLKVPCIIHVIIEEIADAVDVAIFLIMIFSFFIGRLRWTFIILKTA